MATRGKPYKPAMAQEIARIEARRVAARISLKELCDKAHVSVANYRRIRKSGLSFKRTVNALAMAMRTLEGEQKREGEILPFGSGSGPGQPHAPFLQAPARPSVGATRHAGSGPGQPRSPSPVLGAGSVTSFSRSRQ